MPPPTIPDADDREVLAARMVMAQAFAQLVLKGFDALLHFGINYRELPSYKDQTLLEAADKLVLLEGRNKYLLWIERVSNSIDAAVKRKQFRLLSPKRET